MAKQTKQEEITAVAVKDETALTAELGDLAGQFGSMVRVRQELLRVPRLKLTQAMSKAMSAGLARPGEFSCDLKGKVYGDKVTIIPVVVSESASLLYSANNPPAKGVLPGSYKDGDIICSTDNLITSRNGATCKMCPYGEYWNDWGTKDQPNIPGCKSSIDMICLATDPSQADMGFTFDQVMEINFRKNNAKAGRTLVNFIANDPRRVPFGTAYTLKAHPTTKNNYNFFVIQEMMDKRSLDAAEIRSIIPIAKHILEMEKQGNLERDAGADDDVPL